MLAAAVCAAGCSKGSDHDTKSSSPAVTINGVKWYVQLASTEAQRERGLMGRDSLADDEGMLFLFDKPAERSFWMKNCLIPIDVAFIGPDMRVISTHQMRVEPDLRGRAIYPSSGNALYALEVPGGCLRRAGVEPGQTVTFSGFDPRAIEVSP